jgi:hypothetical protein
MLVLLELDASVKNLQLLAQCTINDVSPPRFFLIALGSRLKRCKMWRSPPGLMPDRHLMTRARNCRHNGSFLQ